MGLSEPFLELETNRLSDGRLCTVLKKGQIKNDETLKTSHGGEEGMGKSNELCEPVLTIEELLGTIAIPISNHRDCSMSINFIESC